MKIKKIAVAALVPAAVAGVTVSSWTAVQARHAAHGSTHKQVGKAQTASSGRDGAHDGAQAKAGHRARAEAGHRAHAEPASSPAAQPAAPSSSSPLSGMSAFEQCVAWRESGDNSTASSAGMFGILPATWASLGYPGTAGEASVAKQKAAFDRLCAQYGTSPWAPYDGC